LTIRSVLQQMRSKFKECGIGAAALEAEVLLAFVTGLDRAGVYREWDRDLSKAEEDRLAALTGRRLLGEPVAYLTGSKEFMSLEFDVSPSVLIPRPETELLVETALNLLPPSPTVIDVGAGSGVIAISLVLFAPGAKAYATDCSQEALDVAKGNALRHGVSDRVRFCRGDLLEPLYSLVPAGGSDLIAANMPYIEQDELQRLPGEVKHEPLLALDGGAGGLEHYRRLVPQAGYFLKRGGCLLMEIGALQGEEAAGLLESPQWETVVIKDLAGLDRLVRAVFKG